MTVSGVIGLYASIYIVNYTLVRGWIRLKTTEEEPGRPIDAVVILGLPAICVIGCAYTGLSLYRTLLRRRRRESR